MDYGYQIPVCLPPLGADDGITDSDHLTVVAEPLSAINNKPARRIKKVTVRRLPQSGKDQLRRWFSDQQWEEVYSSVTAHDKAMLFQSIIMEKINQCLPERTVSFSSDDQPWFTPELKQLDKARKLEYRKHRRSFRWKQLNNKFKKIVFLLKLLTTEGELRT